MSQIPEELRNKCQRFSRIVGYYQPTIMWNAGKLAEYNDRKLFKIGDLK